MGIGILVIGDEILSGKRRDAHLGHSIEALGRRGLVLSWCRYLGDEAELLTRNLMETMASGDVVFSFGGIGATPDDLTRQCAATARGVRLLRHAGAAAELEARFGAAAYPNRILMADLPESAELIPNPVNRVPGFSLGDHHFLPGFPQMAWPMMAWVLDTRYPHLRPEQARAEAALWVLDSSESALLDVMLELHRRPGLKLFSLPHLGSDGRRHIELGVKGEPVSVAAAMAWLQTTLTELGVAWAAELPEDRTRTD